jgi:NAD-dependent deacetylase
VKFIGIYGTEVIMNFEEKIEKLNELIKNAKKIVFFGGAGVSTESGIPDFRSKDGLYNTMDVKFEKYSPEYLLSRDCLYKEPKVFFEFYRQKMNCEGIEPNITHKVLAQMEAAGKLTSVITQNIDGLHQKAGSERVWEIHGTTLKNYCRKCGKRLGEDYIFKNVESVPHCECGGMVRPEVVLYGESLPSYAYDEAYTDLAEADLIIVGGTSLSVYPAANFIEEQIRFKKVVLINRDETSLDNQCELVFHENLGEVFSKIEF